MKQVAFWLLAVVIAAAAADAQQPSDLLPELRKGGYVLFIRHPKTNPDQADTDPLNLDNIKAQRQLSDEGIRRCPLVQKERLECRVSHPLSSWFVLRPCPANDLAFSSEVGAPGRVRLVLQWRRRGQRSCPSAPHLPAER